MGLFNKKKKEVSELPDLKPKINQRVIPRPPIKEIEEEPAPRPQALPSFPNSEIGEKITQQAVKDNLTPPRVQEISEKDLETPNTLELTHKGLPTIYPEEHSPITPTPTEKKGPIFVKLDKYNQGLKNLEALKKSVKNIEDALKDLKNIKEKEEKELHEWDLELHEIKTRLQKIQENIFNQV